MNDLPQNPQSNIGAVTCRCKKIVIEMYVAILENGEEIEIRGISKRKLKDGMQLMGTICEDEKQLKYSDGTYSRSYVEEKWLQVSNGR